MLAFNNYSKTITDVLPLAQKIKFFGENGTLAKTIDKKIDVYTTTGELLTRSLNSKEAMNLAEELLQFSIQKAIQRSLSNWTRENGTAEIAAYKGMANYFMARIRNLNPNENLTEIKQEARKAIHYIDEAMILHASILEEFPDPEYQKLYNTKVTISHGPELPPDPVFAEEFEISGELLWLSEMSKEYNDPVMFGTYRLMDAVKLRRKIAELKKTDRSYMELAITSGNLAKALHTRDWGGDKEKKLQISHDCLQNLEKIIEKIPATLEWFLKFGCMHLNYDNL